MEFPKKAPKPRNPRGFRPMISGVSTHAFNKARCGCGVAPRDQSMTGPEQRCVGPSKKTADGGRQ